MRECPKVSVIINTLDRADFLANALIGLSQLHYRDFEVIVVNGPSADKTEALLQTWSECVKRATCDEANLAASRTIGLGLASGEFVAFLDDDAVPHPAWLTRMIAAADHPSVGVVGGYVVDRSGVDFQARKILCDRYGDAMFPGEFFDERRLDGLKSWLYPAPMGTNVLFRRSAIQDVGVFDPVYAYYLEETDLCLRLFDAGWTGRFARDAWVWHQFAESSLRDQAGHPKSFFKLARSKTYFILRHGLDAAFFNSSDAMQAAAEARIAAFAEEKQRHVRNILRNGIIDKSAAATLIDDVESGMEAGRACAAKPAEIKPLEVSDTPFLPFCSRQPNSLSIAFLCRAYPPRKEGGIGRWTMLAAQGLADRGNTVHVITEAEGPPSLTFQSGVWIHALRIPRSGGEGVATRFGLPSHAALWADACRRYLPVLGAFGVDVLSFPIWDVEGLACLDVASFPIAVSLHTTATLSANPEFGGSGQSMHAAFTTAEHAALLGAQGVIANTASALRDVEGSLGLALSAKAVVVPHGTPTAQAPRELPREGPLRVLYVGRFEARKGFDIALDAIAKALADGGDVKACCVGGDPADAMAAVAKLPKGAVAFPGLVSRERLEELYREHDIVLIPSRYESFSLVAIEAMAHGVPVLASRTGGLPDVITEGKSGWLIDPGEGQVDAFARMLKQLAADRDAIREMSHGAYREASERFGARLMCARLEDAFRDLCSQRRGRGA